MKWTKEECEELRRLADGVLPIGWIATRCEEGDHMMDCSVLTCKFRDPESDFKNKIARIAVSKRQWELVRREFRPAFLEALFSRVGIGEKAFA